MKQAEEDLLVISAQNGNLDAFNMLFRHYNLPLIRFAFKLCNDNFMAQDAVQEAWIKCANSLKKLNDPRAFRSWIYRAVRWHTIDHIRKAKSEDVSIDDVHEYQVGSVSDESDGSFNDLRREIAGLADIDRQAVYLFYFEQMKISEIAVVLEIPPGTVKSRLNRARKQLKEKLNIKQEDIL